MRSFTHLVFWQRLLCGRLLPGLPVALAASVFAAEPGAGHTQDIEEVRLLLYKARGAQELGRFDEARTVYEEVLRVDPYNKAARRGMEEVAAARSDYARAAYDHTRGEMLGHVDRAWELAVPTDSTVGVPLPDDAEGPRAGSDQAAKLRSLVLPVVSLEDVTLREAVDFLRGQSVALDEAEIDPALRGVNFVVDVPETVAATRFDVELRNVPLETVLRYINEATRTVASVEPFAVTIRPVNSAGGSELVSRTYRVPPDFLTAGHGGGADPSAAQDPFAIQPERSSGLVARRLSAQEVLESRGVSFPDGASASFSAADSTLRVLNTPQNQVLVEQVVAILADQEPTAVIVEVKILRTEQRNLEELGFDWLLTPFTVGRSSDFTLGGGTVGNGDALDVPAAPDGSSPVTSGVRSGNGAVTGNAIDAFINEGIDLSPGQARAPGILTANGVLRDGVVTAMMRGLNQRKGVDIAAVPSVVTRSGQAASLRSTRELIYPTEYEPPQLPAQVGGGAALITLGPNGEVLDVQGEQLASFPVTPATPTSFEMRETGVILEVLPTVSADKRYIDISVTPDVTSFDGFVNYGEPITQPSQIPGAPPSVVTPNAILMPIFSRMRTTSAVTVADGSTLVLGGLLEDRIQDVEDSVPILGDLPIIGRLFQTTARAPSKLAIVFFVTVRAIDGGGRPFNP